MRIDAQSQPESADDLSDLLSEVWHADTQANNPRTLEFLQAGEQLLHSGLARDPGQHVMKQGRFRAPFDELLNWVSRRRVIEQAKRAWEAGESTAAEKPSESAYRYRWRTQTGYLRDLVVYALRRRLARPDETDDADHRFAEAAGDGFTSDSLDEVIDRTAYNEVRNLNGNKAFRLQMVFQAILADDDHVANALRRIDQTNVRAWKDFYSDSLDRLGLTLRPDVDLDDFAYALQAAGEGVVFRSLLPGTSDWPAAARTLDHERLTSRPLALIAMALLVAFTDPGDGKALRQVVREFSSQAPAGPAR